MAAFSWMLVEGLLLWSKVVAVNLSEERHMKYYYLIGWGTVIFTLGYVMKVDSVVAEFCVSIKMFFYCAIFSLDITHMSSYRFYIPVSLYWSFNPTLLILTCFHPSYRSASAHSHHHTGFGLRKILGGWLLLAQCPERCHLGLCWACHLHHHGQQITPEPSHNLQPRSKYFIHR